MRRVGPLFSLLLLFALPAVGGCGPDKVERGLAPATETDTPEAKSDMSETEKQRQQQIINDMQKQEEKGFDAADSGKQQQEQPAK